MPRISPFYANSLRSTLALIIDDMDVARHAGFMYNTERTDVPTNILSGVLAGRALMSLPFHTQILQFSDASVYDALREGTLDELLKRINKGVSSAQDAMNFRLEHTTEYLKQHNSLLSRHVVVCNPDQAVGMPVVTVEPQNFPTFYVEQLKRSWK